MKWLFLFAGMLISVAPVFAATKIIADKTLNFCSEGSPTTFDPQIAIDETTFSVTRHIYNRLIEFEYGETRLQPALAGRWSVSRDGLSYTLSLRKNVKWQSNDIFKPSRVFNADDVIFSFERQKNTNQDFQYYTSMDMNDLLKEIKKINDDKVVFILNKPNAAFIANLAMDFASIMSKEYFDFLKAQNKTELFETKPIGTGPFMLAQYQKDQSIEFLAFNDYWKGKSKIQKLIFKIVPEAQVRFQKLKAKECDVMAYPTQEQVEDVKKDHSFNVIDKPGINVGYLAINVQKKPFADLKVRQAIAHALNKKVYIDSGFLGQAMVAKNLIPPTMWGYDNSIKDYDYNPTKAKKLLKEAGFPNGFIVELWTLPVSRPYILSGKKLGELMKKDLHEVGIDVRLRTFDWATYLSKSKEGEQDLMQIGWSGDNGDPDNFLYTLMSCSAIDHGTNRSRWCEKSFDEIVERARITTNSATRTELYKKALRKIHEQVPIVPIDHAKIFRILSKNVSGYKIDPLGTDFFYFADIK